jgi:hypothetical protein
MSSTAYEALDAFLQEHKRCGALDGGVKGAAGWMSCQCAARLVALARSGKL